MITYFCDCCGAQLSQYEHGRLRRELVVQRPDKKANISLKVEVMHTLDGTSNAGQVCHKCVTRAVNEGRPG